MCFHLENGMEFQLIGEILYAYVRTYLFVCECVYSVVIEGCKVLK